MRNLFFDKSYQNHKKSKDTQISLNVLLVDTLICVEPKHTIIFFHRMNHDLLEPEVLFLSSCYPVSVVEKSYPEPELCDV